MRVLALLDSFTGSPGPYHFHKDTSHLILWALAQRRCSILYATPADLFWASQEAWVRASSVTVLREAPYFSFHEAQPEPLKKFSVTLMRKDPPVDLEYLYACQLLATAPESHWVVNNPLALIRLNEKLAILNFPKWVPKTLVSCDRKKIDLFVENCGGLAVIKTLDGFGGKAVRKLSKESEDSISLMDDMTRFGTRPAMVQEFLPQVSQGEKRIFLIDGSPMASLLKIPRPGDFQTNPDLGGHLQATTLTRREKKLCADLKPFLKKNGIFFAGIDVIGERLIEINITSPGLLWEAGELDNRRYEDEIADRILKRIKK